MSKIAAHVGERVRQGEVIGYAGSTGLSTGPHLHYELYRTGRTVNPRSIKFTTVAHLSGSTLRPFSSRLSQPKSLNASLPEPIHQAHKTAKHDPAQGTKITI